MSNLIPTWVELGMQNPWISREAFEKWERALSWLDSPFDAKSFQQTFTIEDLSKNLLQTWSIGVAFYFENIAFINQINGGNEWRVIRDDTSFESLSGWACTVEYITDFVQRVQAATPEQLRRLEY